MSSTTLFAGPFLAAQHLARPGEGEQSSLRALLPEVVSGVLEPAGLKERALLLLDSAYAARPLATVRRWIWWRARGCIT